jgi:anti-sigma B factor antagonist
MGSFYIISDEATVEEAGRADVAVVAMSGELDYAASPQLRRRIDGHLKAGRRRLVLDLSDVTFIDSTAIGVILGAVTRLNEAGGGALEIVCADENARVLRIFAITGIDSMIALHGTREEAFSALAVAG